MMQMLLIILLISLAYIIFRTLSNRTTGGNGDIDGVHPLKYIQYVDGEIKQFNNIDNDKINADTKFRIASITKIFTATCLQILANKGLIDLNKPASEYTSVGLPDVTVMELINHKSGAKKDPDWIFDDNLREKYFKMETTTDDTATKALSWSKDEKIFGEKGKYGYSNMGYLVLGHIIENITKMSYFDAFKKYIFEPANITPTLNPDIKLYEKYDYTSYKPATIKWLDGAWATTCGALCASINDLVGFVKFAEPIFNKDFYFMKDGLLHPGDKPNQAEHAVIRKKDKLIIILVAMSLDTHHEKANF
jgi:CubicO group peptidase (beta-lactamase class C family)